MDLTDDNFSMIRNDISSYMNNYSNLQFQDAYSFKSSMESSVLEHSESEYAGQHGSSRG